MKKKVHEALVKNIGAKGSFKINTIQKVANLPVKALTCFLDQATVNKISLPGATTVRDRTTKIRASATIFVIHN